MGTLREKAEELRAIHDDVDEHPRRREVAATAAKFVEAAADLVDQVEGHDAVAPQPDAGLRAGSGGAGEPLLVEIGEDEELEDKTPEQRAAHEAGLPDRSELTEDEKEQVDAEVEAPPGTSATQAAAAAAQGEEVPEQDENAEAPDEA